MSWLKNYRVASLLEQRAVLIEAARAYRDAADRYRNSYYEDKAIEARKELARVEHTLRMQGADKFMGFQDQRRGEVAE